VARLAVVIAILGGIAVGLVQLRRREIVVRHEIQRMQEQQIGLRRRLWDQQVRLGYLTAPREIHHRLDSASFTPGDLHEHLPQHPIRDRAPSGN
jgi:hypothetical protein